MGLNFFFISQESPLHSPPGPQFLQHLHLLLHQPPALQMEGRRIDRSTPLQQTVKLTLQLVPPSHGVPDLVLQRDALPPQHRLQSPQDKSDAAG